MLKLNDRVGLAWRHEISSHIWIHADRIDVIEIMLADYIDAPSAKINSLKTLAREIPSTFYGVSLGLASTHPVDEIRLGKLTRLLDHLENPTWSEQLVAPPRCPAVVEGTLYNLERVRRRTGRLPLLENIATLIAPPGSVMSEAEWITQIAVGADAGLSLDLHNLYANAVNQGLDPFSVLENFPLHHVRQVHLSCGQWITADPKNPKKSEKKLMDENLNDIPEIIFELLVRVGELCPEGLTVIVERDGRHPHFQHLLFEIEKARTALARGRQQRMLPGMGRLLQLHRHSPLF